MHFETNYCGSISTNVPSAVIDKEFHSIMYTTSDFKEQKNKYESTKTTWVMKMLLQATLLKYAFLNLAYNRSTILECQHT